ncbi:DUF167 domain-containing protein [Candidatus Dojkabacteria bacterium]|nr:DUF167 domain-containing protein [Candidatus Dojkabacteria bacterium]
MIVKVKVIPRSKKSSVETRDNDSLVVRVVSAPEKGKANDELIALLADYYSTKKSSISIKHGQSKRIKLVETLT